ncbi:MAG: transglycosylase SLT domain-containing protein [Deltaproteobacteria bacterium]|nr:transglycosylase SLT domain-containing protein [Deltaproteobacteria bacterium]
MRPLFAAVLLVAVLAVVSGPFPASASTESVFDERLDAIAAELRAGRYRRTMDEAAKFVRTDATAQQRADAYFLFGLALLRSGEARESLSYFMHAEAAAPLLDDASAVHRVRGEERAELADAALHTLASARQRYPDSPLLSESTVWRARLLRESGDGLAAAALFESLADKSSASSTYTEYYYEAGVAYESAGANGKALEAYRKVMDARRVDRFTNRAFAAHKALLKKTHGDEFPGWYAGYVDRYLAGHLKAGRHRQIQPALEAKREVRGGLSIGDEFQLGLSAFYNHDNDVALGVMGLIAQGTREQHADAALYRLAKTQTRIGDNVGSRASFEKLIERFPSSGYAPSTRYQLAWLDFEDNNYESAYRYFANRLKRPTGSQREYLTWLAAWSAFRCNKLAVAESYLSRLIKDFRHSRDADRYHYWRGRIRQMRKDGKGALEDYKEANKVPKSYYGMLSAQRLEPLGVKPKLAEDDFEKTNKDGSPAPALDAGMFPRPLRPMVEKSLKLARFGCPQDASTVIREMPDLPDESSLDQRYAWLRFLQYGSHYYQALNLAGQRRTGMYQFSRNLAAPMGQTYYSFLYPRSFGETVHQYARRRRLPEGLIYSVIYNESRVKPWVVSPANAIGLMQIVPRTGHRIADALGDADFHVDDLYDPYVNIRYGTWYLRAMLDRFEGNEVCAIASYNAGPDVVGKWLRNKKDLPRDLFIEEIPYKETNNYVKKVWSTWQLYNKLYDLAPAG